MNLVDDGARAPMCVCWRMFDGLFRNALCALASVDSRYAASDWDFMPGPERKRIVKVVDDMNQGKEQKK